MSDKLPAQRAMDSARKEVDGWPPHKGTPKVRAEVARLRQLPAQRVIEAARKYGHWERAFDPDPEHCEKCALLHEIRAYEASADPGVVVSGEDVRLAAEGLARLATLLLPPATLSPSHPYMALADRFRAALEAK